MERGVRSVPAGCALSSPAASGCCCRRRPAFPAGRSAAPWPLTAGIEGGGVVSYGARGLPAGGRGPARPRRRVLRAAALRGRCGAAPGGCGCRPVPAAAAASASAPGPSSAGEGSLGPCSERAWVSPEQHPGSAFVSRAVSSIAKVSALKFPGTEKIPGCLSCSARCFFFFFFLRFFFCRAKDATSLPWIFFFSLFFPSIFKYLH